MNQHLGDTDPFLPRVSSETATFTLASMIEHGLAQYLTQAAERLADEQPNLSDTLVDIIGTRAKTDAEHDKMIETALFVYDALRNQAITDRDLNNPPAAAQPSPE